MRTWVKTPKATESWPESHISVLSVLPGKLLEAHRLASQVCRAASTHPQHIILKMNVNITLAVCFLVYRTSPLRNLSPLCVQIKPYLCKTHPKLPSSLRAARFWDEVLSWSRHRCKQRANQTPESRPRSTLSHGEEEKVFGAALSGLGEGSLPRAQCWGHLNSSANTQQQGSDT